MVLREQALATIRHTFYLCSKLHFAHNRAINCNMPNTISKSLYICCGKSMKIRNTRSETVPPIILQSLLGERGARRSMFRMALIK